jgi:hypothetical protein
MSTRLSTKKVEDFLVALLTAKEPITHDLIKQLANKHHLISEKSTNPLLTNGTNVSYTKEQKKALMDSCKKDKPTDMKPENRFFDEKIGRDAEKEFKKTHNLKKVDAEGKKQIINEFRAIPANENIWQGYVKDSEQAIDEYYQAIMDIKDENGKHAFRGNALYTFSRKSCEMSLAKKTTKTTEEAVPVVVPRRSERVKAAAEDVPSDDE